MRKRLWLFFKRNRVFLLLLTVFVAICYVNSLKNAFISDDLPSISLNPYINQFAYVLDHPQAFGRNIFLYIVVNIFGIVPWSYRVINIFFHLGSVWLLFSFFYLLTKKRMAAFVAAALFAVHPILVESVTWISGGGYAQYTFFFLISLIFYILHDRKNVSKYYLLSFIFFILSLVSNRNAIVFPGIFFAYDLSVQKASKKWRYYVPFFALSALWLYLFLGPLQERITTLQTLFYQPTRDSNFFITIPIVLYSYLELIFYPLKLTFYHTELMFSVSKFIFALVITLIYFALLIYTYFKNKKYFFWLSIFIIPLLPTLTPLKIAWAVAERYAYFSLIGIIGAVVLFANRFYEKKKYKTLCMAIFVLVITLLSFRTIVRNTDWKTGISFWTATGKISPSSPMNHYNLGDAYAQSGNYAKAIAEFKRAIELFPNYSFAHHKLGNAYKDTGKIVNALESYQMAIKYNPGSWESYLNISGIFFEMGAYKEAEENIMQAINIAPHKALLYTNLAAINFKMGKMEEAKKNLMKTIEIDPANEKARNGLEMLEKINE